MADFDSFNFNLTGLVICVRYLNFSISDNSDLSEMLKFSECLAIANIGVRHKQ